MDAVERKLAQFDLPHSPHDLLGYAADRIPLLPPALGLIAGIWLQEQIRPVVWIWLLLGAVLVVVTAVAFHRKRASSQVLVTVATLGFLCAGAIRMAVAGRVAPDDVRKVLADDPRPAAIRGLIVRDLRVDDRDGSLNVTRPMDPSTTFYLRAGEIQTAGGWAPVQGTLRVWVGEPVNDLEIGDHVQVHGWLDRVRPATNPGQFDIAAYLRDQGILAVATVKSRQGIERLPNSLSGLPARIVASIRHGAWLALSGDWPAGTQSLGLAQALLLGYRQDIDSRLYEAFCRTGLLHYVSLSGMHFGILVGIVWFMAKTAGLLRLARAAVCAVAVGIFLLAIPPSAPALRAGIICWVFCASLLLRRQGHPINTLAIAAMILLLARPTQLFDASWQLSFACMLGIFSLSRRIDGAFHEMTGNRLRPSNPFEAPFAIRILKGLACGVIALLSVGLGAWLGSAGILLYQFYSLTPLSVVWTVLVFPGVWVVMMLGLVKILVSFLMPPLGPLTAGLLAGSTDVLIWAVERLGDLDVSTIRIGHICAAPVLLYYTLLMLAMFAPFQRPAVRKVVYVTLAAVLVAWVGWTKWQHTHRSDLRLTCLDVGHGQAIVAKLPGSKTILLDAGSMYRPGIGSRIVNPFLDYCGLSRLDAVIVSHADIDHINGLPEVLHHCRASSAYADLRHTAPGPSKADTLLLRGFLDQEGLPLQPLANLPSNWGRGTEISILWPPADYRIAPTTASDNDLSAVLLIRFAGRNILLCSDIERSTQRQLLQLYPDLRADVLVVPHHGSAKTLAQEFVARLDPQVLICSCSRSQYQDRQVAEPKTGQAAYYTGRDGAIDVHVDLTGQVSVASYLAGLSSRY